MNPRVQARCWMHTAGIGRPPRCDVSIGCTQFQRALDQLGIDLICANTPQAKGRVERANRTLQDRFVKELRLEGIDNIEAANAWCDDYVEKYNARFARTPLNELDLHTPLRGNENAELILSNCVTRKLSTTLTLQHGNLQHLLDDTPAARLLIGQPIAIHTYVDGHIELRANSQVFAYNTLAQQRLTKHIDVDSKSLRATLDKKQRERPERANRTGAATTQGVKAAKNASAHARA